MDASTRVIFINCFETLVDDWIKKLEINNYCRIGTKKGGEYKGKVLDTHDGFIDLNADDNSLVVISANDIKFIE